MEKNVPMSSGALGLEMNATYRDVVSVSSAATGADNLEGVEDIGDQTITLRDEVIGRLHVATKPAGTDEGANEEAAV